MKEMFEQFFGWFQNLGGTIPPNFEEVLQSRHMKEYEPVSTFKDRAGYIKQKYNHKFKFRVAEELKDHPDISKLKFEKK